MANANETSPATPPQNTEENRRELAWDFIDSCDSKTLYHMLADMLCADWEESDEDFQDWWRSQREPDDA
jgi:hypothetical protein